MARYKPLFAVALFLIAGCTEGPSLRRILSDADMLMRTGRAESALQKLQEAQVDHPHSDALLFDIGCAQSAMADARAEPLDTETTLRQAHETFLRLAGDLSPSLGASATFNAATVLIRLDTTLVHENRYEDRIKNLETAIELFADLVASDPDFIEAADNLDHARYKLSLLRQNPPRDNEEDEEEEESDPPKSGSAVDSVTTQIPQAQAEVVDGNTIVLHLPSREEDAP